MRRRLVIIISSIGILLGSAGLAFADSSIGTNISTSAGGTITADGLLTANAGLNASGATVNFNDNSNNNVNLATGTSTGTVTIGGGLGSVAIDSTTWGISSAGAAGFTSLTSAGGTINLNVSSNFAVNIATGTSSGGITIGNANNTVSFTNLSASGNIDLSGGNLVGTTIFYADGSSVDSNKTAFVITDPSGNRTITFPNASGTVALLSDITGSSDLQAAYEAGNDITTSGPFGAFNISGDQQIQLFASDVISIRSAGGVALNTNTNGPVDINTGTSTGTVTIGAGLGAVAIDSTTWDVTAAGIASGFTNVTMSGNLTMSPQVVTISGVGGDGATAYTLTPTSSVVRVKCTDPDGCTITMGVVGPVDGQIVHVMVAESTTAIAFQTGSEAHINSGAPFNALQYDSISMVYNSASTTWVQLALSDY